MGRENARQPCSGPVDKRLLLFQQGLPSAAECQVARKGIDPLGYAFGALAIFHGLQSERGAVRHPFHGRTEFRGFPLDFHLNDREKASQATEPPFVDILAKREPECGQRHLAAHPCRQRPTGAHPSQNTSPPCLDETSFRPSAGMLLLDEGARPSALGLLEFMKGPASGSVLRLFPQLHSGKPRP